jgi:DNA-binding IclR family transcriptional regulator
MPEAIPNAVHLLLQEHIQSIAQMELLLRLREQPETAESVPELAQKLYAPENMTLSLLEGLRASGLVARSEEPQPRYRYAPSSPELGQAVDQLADLYRQRRVTIINLIYASPLKNVKDFADAFRLRKPEDK